MQERCFVLFDTNMNVLLNADWTIYSKEVFLSFTNNCPHQLYWDIHKMLSAIILMIQFLSQLQQFTTIVEQLTFIIWSILKEMNQIYLIRIL